MSKSWNPRKETVELAPGTPRPSKIRRAHAEPEKPTTLAGKIRWDSREWEIRLAIAGVIFFALAISAVVIDLGELLSN